MSPKNARLETNGDQNSSAIVQTHAIVGAKVSTDETESIPKAIARWVGSQDLTALWIQSFECVCQNSNDRWTIVAASRAESARNCHCFISKILFLNKQNERTGSIPKAIARWVGSQDVTPLWIWKLKSDKSNNWNQHPKPLLVGWVHRI